MLKRFAGVIGYLAIVICVLLFSTILGLGFKQIISLTIFVSFIAGSLFYWPFRNAFALAGVALLLIFQVLDIPHLIEFAQLDLILFLVGMMTVIGYLEEKGFFEWLVGALTKPFYHRPVALVGIILMLGAVMAALVDEVTSILFMMAIMLRVLDTYRVERSKMLPFILFLVFTTNVGSSMLPVGNPIGVMIAFRAGLTFVDFIRWVFLLGLLNAAVITLVGLPFLSKIGGLSKVMALNHSNNGEREVKFTRKLIAPFLVFVGVLAGLILHHNVEEMLHLPKNLLLLATPLIGAGISLFLHRQKARDLVERRVDWWTLLYFILLFSSVGTLKYTGVTELIADGLLQVVGSNLFYAILLISGVAGILTAFMDNVLAVATIIPIVQSIAAAGIQSYSIWWAMLIAGTYFGNATVIGSTANIVAAGFVERRGYGTFSMVGWILLGVPISLLTFFIALALLYLQIPLMPKL
jgi:Na+/H+ antiporter NhaD/arsenite permease-like protein